MAKLRAVLFGTGNWAGVHAAAYADCTEVELVGVCGHRDAERLNALADRYGIAERSLNLEALLHQTQPDILDIAAHPSFRLEGVRLGVGLPGLRLINLEKPIALTPGDAYAIERLCQENHKLLTINHQKKFLPAWRKTHEAIAAGAIGTLEFMRATCQGNLMVQGKHLTDMALHFNDYCPASWVMAQVDGLEGLDDPRTPAPAAAAAMVCFQNGVRAAMTFGAVGHPLPGETNQWYQFGMEVYGTHGHIKVTLNQTWQLTTYADGRTVTGESSWDRDYIHAQTAHLDAAARYARDPSVGHVSDREKSSLSYQVIMAIYASGCDGGLVELPRRFDDDLISRLRARGHTS